MAPQTERATVGTDWSPPRAATWNELMDMLGDWRRNRARPHAPYQPAELPIPTNCVRVLNDTGAQLRLGEVVEIQDQTVTDVDRHFPWFDADTPDETKPFAICAEPIPDGKIGLAFISGRCPALIDVQATTDLWAFVESGQDVLKGDRFWGDVRILTTPAGTGERLLWVKIEASPQEWLGKTDAQITKGGATGTVSVWSGTPGSETDTTFNITGVYNRFATVGSGKWVIVRRLHRKPYLAQAECPLT